MQGISERSYSQLCFALNNTADECLRLARLVGAKLKAKTKG